MEQQFKVKVSEAMNAWLNENPERTLSALADESDVAKLYVSRIKNGVFEIDNKATGKTTIIADEYFYRIAESIGLMHRSHSGEHWETNNFKMITKACKRAQNTRMRTILDGDTGHGKTYTLDHYQIHHDKVIYLKVTRSMTERNMLEAILKKLGHRDFPRGNREKINLIRFELTGTPGFLLIIDESEYLRPALFHTLKEIADFTENKCGFILAGYGIIKKIGKLADKRREGFPQLKRRFFPNRMILPERIEPSEKRTICENSGITDKQAVNVIVQYCNDFDMLSQIVVDISAWQKSHGRKITGAEVLEMFKDSFDL